jgi:protein-S-isoprenylcysteine O-methyltransferase Ste14
MERGRRLSYAEGEILQQRWPMTSKARTPLAHVWAAAVAVFLVTAWASRRLSQQPAPIPAYWVGLVALLVLGVALVWSWRGLGDPGVHSTPTRRVLRGVVALGAVLWCLAMVFPFL